MIEIIGVIGGIIGIGLFFPQIIKCIKTRSTKDISAWTYILILINQVLWSAYGIHKEDPIIYTPNLIGIGLSILILALKKRYDR